MRETGHSECGERLPVVTLGFRVVVAKSRLIVYRLSGLLVLSISLWDCYSCLHPVHRKVDVHSSFSAVNGEGRDGLQRT